MRKYLIVLIGALVVLVDQGFILLVHAEDPKFIQSLKAQTRDINSEISKNPLALRKIFSIPPDLSSELSHGFTVPSSPASWLGISLKEAKPVFLPHANDVSPAIKVLQVFPESPASKAGILPGDRIIEMEGTPLNLGKENSLLLGFRRRISKFEPGQLISLKVLRDEEWIDLLVTLEEKPTTNVLQKLHPELEDPLEKGNSLIHSLLMEKKLISPFEQTLNSLKARTAQVVSTAVKGKSYNPFRLSEINFVLNQPMELPLVSNQIVQRLFNQFNKERKNLSRIIELAGEELDLKIKSSERSVVEIDPKKVQSFKVMVEKILQSINRAKEIRRKALSQLSSEELKFLYDSVDEIWANKTELASKDKTELEKREMETTLLKFLKIALKIDLEKILIACNEIAKTLDVETLTKIKNEVVNISPFLPGWSIEDHENKTIISTSFGTLILGSKDDNQYTEDASLIIDLGGNDSYFNNAASSKLNRPFSVVIDFSGNDLYLSSESLTQGTGFLGGGFLIDLGGDDRYLAQSFSQGSALLGVGMLVDVQGNDEFNCHAFCQGSGFLGAGVVALGEGNDRFSAAISSQGFGFVKGFGALINVSGDDKYFAGGVYPDFREPQKAYQSMSQGFGLGLRPWESLVGTSGGIGVMADAEGNDTYIGDYFSQGSSYWFALGILADRAGHDTYLSGRYSQGAGVHFSSGVLMDDAGDDSYLAKLGVSQGCGHDFGLGFLLDHKGNDRYISGVLAQGMGNANGIGVLNDNDGADNYFIREIGQGEGAFETSRNLGSFGFLIDTSGEADKFSKTHLTPPITLQSKWGLLVDLP